jgi:radical SAM protein with 4Fe4S-binding SPASM domain
MNDSITTYKKYQSFTEIRHRKPLQDVLPRIRSVRNALAGSGISAVSQSLVATACDEILGTAPTPAGHPAFTLNTQVIEEIDKLTDSELPRYLLYRYRYEVFPERKLLDHFPPLLQIEPASICNYRCVFCYQTDTVFTKRSEGHMGMMSLDLFKRLIDQTQGRCEAVTLASRGEPLINPHINDMLEYAAGKFLAMKMNTNAWYLDETKCHAILQSGLNTLVFSADAASEPQYSQFRVGGTLERILKNITLFREIRMKHYPNARLLTRVSGVQVPGTPNLDQMENFWGELVDQVAFVNYNPWENTYEQPVNTIETACSDLWRRMFVWWDGRVNPCDVDYKSTLSVGTAANTELGDLWRSDAYTKLREKHLDRQRSRCFPCQRCTVI